MTTTTDTDLSILSPAPEYLTLGDGTEVRINRLRTRELMALLRIFTNGAGEVLGDLVDAQDGSPEAFAGKVIGTLMFAIPEAPDETLAFFRSIVSPAEEFSRDKNGAARREAAEDHLDDLLDNPDPSDLILIAERVIRIESPHIIALGKQIGLLLNLQPKTPEKKTAKSKNSSPKTSET